MFCYNVKKVFVILSKFLSVFVRKSIIIMSTHSSTRDYWNNGQNSCHGLAGCQRNWENPFKQSLGASKAMLLKSAMHCQQANFLRNVLQFLRECKLCKVLWKLCQRGQILASQYFCSLPSRRAEEQNVTKGTNPGWSYPLHERKGARANTSEARCLSTTGSSDPELLHRCSLWQGWDQSRKIGLDRKNSGPP